MTMGICHKIMKTAKEILIEFGCPDVTFDENVTMYYPAILSAMEEYANARVGEAMRWRDPKEELPEDEQVLVKTDKDEILLVTYWVEKGDFVYWDAPIYNVIGWRPIE
jgi:hypothetical protein